MEVGAMCFNKGEGVLGRRFKYLILLGLLGVTSYDVSKQDFFCSLLIIKLGY